MPLTDVIGLWMSSGLESFILLPFFSSTAGKEALFPEIMVNHDYLGVLCLHLKNLHKNEANLKELWKREKAQLV